MAEDGALADEGTRNDSLACITVSFHSADALADLVDSLVESGVWPARTIVVNNAPEDHLSALDRANYPLEVVTPGTNTGYGGAINVGAALLDETTKWILVTNPDVRFDHDAIRALLAIAAASPRAGLLGPRILDDDGSVYPSARELPSLRTGIGHALFANVWPDNPWSKRYRGENRPQSDQHRETGWLSGSCLLIRKEAFDQLGGFDSSYFMYFEDVDLGKRMTEAGWLNLYVPHATIVHTGAHSTSSVASTMRKAHHRSAYQYLSRKYSAWYLWPLRAGLRVALSTRARLTRRG